MMAKKNRRKQQASPAIAEIAARLAMENTEICVAPKLSISKPQTVVVAGNGVFQLRRTKVGVTTHKLSEQGIAGLPKQPTGFQLSVPKLPWDIFAQAVKFFIDIRKDIKAEAMVRGYYSEQMGWTLHVPKQTVSGASVDISATEPPPNYGERMLEIHSHPGSSSSFSSVDDNDEKAELIYGCVANLDDFPNWHWRIGTGIKQWMDVNITDIVDLPTEPITVTCPIETILKGAFINPFLSAEYPAEWKAQVTEKKYDHVKVQTLFNATRNWKMPLSELEQDALRLEWGM